MICSVCVLFDWTVGLKNRFHLFVTSWFNNIIKFTNNKKKIGKIFGISVKSFESNAKKLKNCAFDNPCKNVSKKKPCHCQEGYTN